MGHWWIKFSDRESACVAMATREEAEKIINTNSEGKE
jgi:hypothetical protein